MRCTKTKHEVREMSSAEVATGYVRRMVEREGSINAMQAGFLALMRRNGNVGEAAARD